MQDCQHLTKIYEGVRTKCADCGQVLEEDFLCNDVVFMDVGGKVQTMASGVEQQKQKELRSQKFRSMLLQNCEQLQLSDEVLQRAHQLYILAQRSGTSEKCHSQARRGAVLAAALLFIAVRELTEDPYLLIDFAANLDIELKDIARTAKVMQQLFSISFKFIQPFSFAVRFYESLLLQLEGNTKTLLQQQKPQILDLTNQIIDKATKYGIHLCKLPQSLPVASLFLAFQAYNFNVSLTDLADLSNLSVTTIEQRLKQILELEYFQNTTISEIIQNKDDTFIKNSHFKQNQKFIAGLENYQPETLNSKLNFKGQLIFPLELDSVPHFNDLEQDYLANESQQDLREQIYQSIYEDYVNELFEKRREREVHTQRKLQKRSGVLVDLPVNLRRSLQLQENSILQNSEHSEQQNIPDLLNEKEKSSSHEHEYESDVDNDALYQ